MNRIQAKRQLQFRSVVATQPEENCPEEAGRLIKKKRLINILNRINFQDGTILINFKHPEYNKVFSLPAKPLPCINETLDCLWLDSEDFDPKLKSYDFLNFQISNGLKHILVEAELADMNKEGIRFSLPQICYEVSTRKVKRHCCKEVYAQISQSGIVFYGILSGFSAVSFSIDISYVPFSLLQKLNFSSPVDIIIKNDKDVIYSGACEVIRQANDQKMKFLVLRPLLKELQRFKPKKYRSVRQKLSPSPNIIFIHPIINKSINLEVVNISGSGLLVEEKYDNSVLLPGMIIPEFYIEFTNNFSIKGKAQVLYSKEEENKCAKCGLGILDMEVPDQVRLSSLLHQAMDTNSYVCAKVDPNVLWNFFFETGFVYPEKYAAIHEQKEKFKKLYEKLYSQQFSDIAINFIYQDKGAIYGHMSMFRFYQKTWIINHHAAVSSNFFYNAGVAVLEQIGRYINEFHRLSATHMNYVACYFRPENKFPNHVFGSLARKSNDPQKCSLDQFAYFHYRKSNEQTEISGSWTVTETQSGDLYELQEFYKYESGGLMLDALDLHPETHSGNDELNKEYHRLGLKKGRHLLSLKNEGNLIAVGMANVSDIGLSLSDLANCITVFTLYSGDLPQDMFYSFLSVLSDFYEEDDVPVLVHPVIYFEDESISYDKTYYLWILSMEHLDNYFTYLERIFHRTNKSSLPAAAD